MFSRIQTRHFRSLKAVDRSLAPFQALVGPNASGKTTFLDVIAFLGELMCNRGDVLRTVRDRSSVFESLLWKGEGQSFQLAVEAMIPESITRKMGRPYLGLPLLRYELEVGMVDNEIGLDREILWICPQPIRGQLNERNGFPRSDELSAGELFANMTTNDGSPLILKSGKLALFNMHNGATNDQSFMVGRGKSALASQPDDETFYPATTWFKSMLENGVQHLVLDSLTLRKPSAPGMGRGFKPDGSNLPWVVAELRKDAERFQKWLEHVRTALEDIIDITVIERPEDRHAYLVIHYANGAKVPSWLASDGTLRMLALTIPAYLTDLEGVFLIEEPENGVHPKALETVLQSLMSIRNCQVLMATHSPVALNMLEARDILCFAKDSEGATDIVSGLEHPALQEWKLGEPSLGVLFASGVLS